MKILFLFTLPILFIGCLASPPTSRNTNNITFYKELSDELDAMAAADQAAQNRYTEIAEGKLTFKELDAIQDSVFRKNAVRLKEIFTAHGYPGFDLVGTNGENNFWLMVQHCDFDVEFQKAVLAKMKIKVDEGHADPSHFGLLTDRVAMNSGQLQVYGTQVDYDTNNGRAFPKPITDSINVDVRRKSIGLPPLYEYLNDRIDDFWEMNEAMIIANKIVKKPYYKRPE